MSRLSNIEREKDIFRKYGRGKKDGDNSFRPSVPQPEPDEELLAELCRLPPLSEDQGGQMRPDQSFDDIEAIVVICRVRSMSPACSSRRTSKLFALQLGLRSGTSRETK